MSSIKVLLWDIDGTLLNFEKAEKQAIRRCFSIFGLGECTDRMLMRYSAINRKLWEQLERGEITKPEVLEGRFREFFEEENICADVVPKFNQTYQICLGDTICFEEGAYELVKSLKGEIRQYAVTNGTKTAQRRKLARSGLDQLLDGVFISDEIGAEKPTREFFDAIWDVAGHYKRDEIMIVGDSLTSDMKGGNNAGIVCCWYNPGEMENTLGVKIDYEIRHIKEVQKFL